MMKRQTLCIQYQIISMIVWATILLTHGRETEGRTCKTPPAVNGIYRIVEALPDTCAIGDENIVRGLLTNVPDSETVLYGPSLPLGLPRSTMNLRVSDVNPYFVFEATVLECDPLQDEMIGCVNGFTNGGDERACVWTETGACMWTLQCSDNDDVSFKHIHVVDVDEDGHAALLINNVFETGPQGIMEDGSVNPRQAEYGFVSYSVYERVLEDGSAASVSVSAAMDDDSSPAGDSGDEYEERTTEEEECSSRLPPRFEPGGYAVKNFGRSTGYDGVEPTIANSGARVRIFQTADPYLVALELTSDVGEWEGGTRACAWVPLHTQRCDFMLRCVENDDIGWATYIPTRVVDDVVLSMTFTYVESGPRHVLENGMVNDEHNPSTVNRATLVIQNDADADADANADADADTEEEQEWEVCVSRTMTLPQLSGRYMLQSRNALLSGSTDLTEEEAPVTGVHFSATDDMYLVRMESEPDRMPLACLWTFASCTSFLLTCVESEVRVQPRALSRMHTFPSNMFGSPRILVLTHNGRHAYVRACRSSSLSLLSLSSSSSLSLSLSLSDFMCESYWDYRTME